MKLIVGLGNPGEKYENTRHNVGFLVVDRLVGEKGWAVNKAKTLEYVYMNFGREAVEVIKPLTFMNESGQAVVGPFKKHSELKPEDVYVVHDDLDIRLSEYKIHFGKGPKVHYGIESIENHLKTDQFWRVRVGVENRKVAGNRGIPGMKYVLQKFSHNEKVIIDEVVGEVVRQLMDLPGS